MDKFQEKQLEDLRSGKENCYDNASIYTVLLDLCLGNDVEEVERLLEEVKKELMMQNKNCCVCGNSATDYHQSIFGQIKHYVCALHYKETYPAIAFDNSIKGNRIGLMNEENEWVDLKKEVKNV